MAGQVGRATVGLLLAAAACSGGHHENARTTSSDDRDHADARPAPNDAGRRDAPGPFDAQLAPFDAPTFDARDYYCNMPNPGPCCCDPLVWEIRPPVTESCDFSIVFGRGFDPTKVNVVVEMPDSGQDTLYYVDECPFDGTGWMWVSTAPAVLRLCPVTCRDVASGGYAALQVVQGCPSIACPPP